MRTIETSLRSLTPYEPNRPVPGPPAAARGQLELDLSLGTPRRRTGRTAEPPGPGPEQRFLRQLLNAILEVREGSRPPAQLRNLVDPRLYQRLLAEPKTTGERYLLGSVRASRPAPAAIEACGTVRAGRRTMAVAARLERSEDRWRCTSFALLTQGRPR
ncbi:Rv3235 family protein [Amycolatopsis nigrescens]|uniref:Rv3235 family protein n=1 Tax=Amycolatopsis nigrescens TaxID=381445 RepID=UPI00037458B8|nr:Rv3235 family protein [Amycolatopsis nigrescens]